MVTTLTYGRKCSESVAKLSIRERTGGGGGYLFGDEDQDGAGGHKVDEVLDEPVVLGGGRHHLDDLRDVLIGLADVALDDADRVGQHVARQLFDALLERGAEEQRLPVGPNVVADRAHLRL